MGVKHCRGGGLVCAQSNSAAAESCDGQDDNRDGAMDKDACQQDGGQTEDGGTPPVPDAGQPMDGGQAADGENE